jgi:hypothetical protein
MSLRCLSLNSSAPLPVLACTTQVVHLWVSLHRYQNLALYRVQFIGHSAKHALSSITLDKKCHSAQTIFAERQKFGIHRRSGLGRDVLVERHALAKCDPQQRVVSSRL